VTRDSHPVAALGAARSLPKRLNEGLRLRWKSVGFFKNRTEIPRRFASRNDKIFAFIPYAGGAQLGHLVCVHCGEKILGSDPRRWADVPLRPAGPQNDNRSKGVNGQRETVNGVNRETEGNQTLRLSDLTKKRKIHKILTLISFFCQMR